MGGLLGTSFCARESGLVCPLSTIRDEGGKATKPKPPSGIWESGHEFRLPQKGDSARVQLVPNNVNLLAAVDPRRDRAAETRLYFASPVAVLKQRCARSFFGCHRSVLTKIFDEIGRALIDLQQRFARRSFGINHVVAFELDMEELQFIESARYTACDRRVVDEVTRRNQHAIDQQCVRLSDVQIGMRNIGTEG